MTKKFTVSVFDGPQHFCDYQFEQNAITIGRDESNSIVLSNSTVSASHAKVDVSSMTIFDLGSVNGIFLGDRRISCAPLEYSMPIKIGDYRIIIAPYSPTNRHGDEAMTLNLKRPSLSVNRFGDDAQTLVVKRSPVAGSSKARIPESAAEPPIAQSDPMKAARLIALALIAMFVGYHALLTVF